jgi:hypothetical protein
MNSPQLGRGNVHGLDQLGASSQAFLFNLAAMFHLQP